MPRLEYFLVSESSTVDNETGALSVFNVINEIKVESFPAVLPKLALVTCWIPTPDEIRDGDEFQVTFEFSVPGSTENGKIRSSFQAESSFQHLIMNVVGVPVARPGEIVIALLLDDQKQASHTIFVTA
ncbi:MAG: hypothetical protein ABSG86_11265 [Thermoguttaceae bacterium]|jgi:hypothetical protein